MKFKRLSYDHRADDEEEKRRVQNSGGTIINNRVMGALMLSRAFGDFELKSFGVKCEPYYSYTEIDLNEKNQFVILACDGVWDFCDASGKERCGGGFRSETAAGR